MDFTSAVSWWEDWQLRIFVLSSLFLQLFLCITSRLRKNHIPSWLRFFIWLAYLGSDAVAIYALAALFNLHKKEEWVSNRSKVLQVLWAPVLLVHIGGQSGITAYNIEDNELWRRHVVTSVSQVAVAIYVFSKLPRPAGPLYLGTAVCLFLVGVGKCILKPWDMKRVSITSLVSSEKAEIYSLEEYVKTATDHFSGHKTIDIMFSGKPYNLCVDMALPYSERLASLKMMTGDPSSGPLLVQCFLAETFDRLYTKTVLLEEDLDDLIANRSLMCGPIIRLSCLVLTVLAIILFGTIHKEAYEGTDVKITYFLLCLTAAVDYLGPMMAIIVDNYNTDRDDQREWPEQLAQCNLIGYLAHNKRHRRSTKMATLLMCKDYLDQFWYMKTFVSSTESITKLIHAYLVEAWTEHITDLHTYKAFNNNRGQWTLSVEGCSQALDWSLRRPFDESVLLWHLATDFCFYQAQTPSSHEEITRCREMSSYMAYLLFVNPEMLMPGARRNLFVDAYTKLRDMTPDEMQLNEKELVDKIIIPNVQIKMEDSSIIHDAWKLADGLNNLEGRIWKVIQGVWVEMLCFSASRCRAYLHVKSLGNGGEYLSHVWMLLALMGMQTLAETMRVDLHREEENGGDAIGPRSVSTAAAGDVIV